MTLLGDGKETRINEEADLLCGSGHGKHGGDIEMPELAGAKIAHGEAMGSLGVPRAGGNQDVQSSSRDSRGP